MTLAIETMGGHEGRLRRSSAGFHSSVCDQQACSRACQPGPTARYRFSDSPSSSACCCPRSWSASLQAATDIAMRQYIMSCTFPSSPSPQKPAAQTWTWEALLCSNAMTDSRHHWLIRNTHWAVSAGGRVSGWHPSGGRRGECQPGPAQPSNPGVHKPGGCPQGRCAGRVSPHPTVSPQDLSSWI